MTSTELVVTSKEVLEAARSGLLGAMRLEAEIMDYTNVFFESSSTLVPNSESILGTLALVAPESVSPFGNPAFFPPPRSPPQSSKPFMNSPEMSVVGYQDQDQDLVSINFSSSPAPRKERTTWQDYLPEEQKGQPTVSTWVQPVPPSAPAVVTAVSAEPLVPQLSIQPDSMSRGMIQPDSMSRGMVDAEGMEGAEGAEGTEAWQIIEAVPRSGKAEMLSEITGLKA